ncbi:MAG: hypothetical protein AB9879_01235 [Methanothrix sp.]
MSASLSRSWRGDSRKEAIDHIDLKELKEAYLACILLNGDMIIRLNREDGYEKHDGLIES